MRDVELVEFAVLICDVCGKKIDAELDLQRDSWTLDYGECDYCGECWAWIARHAQLDDRYKAIVSDLAEDRRQEVG